MRTKYTAPRSLVKPRPYRRTERTRAPFAAGLLPSHGFGAFVPVDSPYLPTREDEDWYAASLASEAPESDADELPPDDDEATVDYPAAPAHPEGDQPPADEEPPYPGEGVPDAPDWGWPGRTDEATAIRRLSDAWEPSLPPLAGGASAPSLDPELDEAMAEPFPRAIGAVESTRDRYSPDALAGVRRLLWGGADVV